MAQQDPFAKYAVADEDPFAKYAVAAEPPSRLQSAKLGAKEGVGDLVEGAKTTAKALGSMLLGGGMAGAAQQMLPREVVGQLLDPATRGEAVAGLKPDMSDPVRGSARFAVGTLLPMLLPGAPKAIRALKGLSKVEAVPAVAAPRLAPKASRTIVDDIADALEEVRQPEAPKRISIPEKNAQPTVTYPRVSPKSAAAEPPKPPQPPSGGGWKRISVPPRAEAPAPPPARPRLVKRVTQDSELPESWKALLKKETPAEEPIELSPIADEPPMWDRSRRGTAEGDLRTLVGADDAAAMLGKEADEVRDIAGGPKRRPWRAESREMDLDYERRILDEKGGVDPKLAVKMGVPIAGAVIGAEAVEDGNEAGGAVLGGMAGLAAANPGKAAKALQTARVTAMLSGYAPVKSLAGNAGAIATRAFERGSFRPIAEAMRVPTNVRNIRKGWKEGSNPSAMEGMSKINVFGRGIGALDHATTEALKRSGDTLQDAQRVLLTKPLTGDISRTLNTPVGRALVPFQRTPFNSALESIESMQEVIGQPSKGAASSAKSRGELLRRKALTVAAPVAGAAAGEETDNPVALSILAALAGPRALPFAAGAALSAGPNVIERMGVGLPDASVKDLVYPLRPLDRPALMKLLEDLGLADR